MNIDDFPFDKFRKYRNEKLINKVAKYINNTSELEHILNVYAQLGMIDATRVEITFLDKGMYPVHLYNPNSVVWVRDRTFYKSHILLFSVVILMCIYSIIIIINRCLND